MPMANVTDDPMANDTDDLTANYADDEPMMSRCLALTPPKDRSSSSRVIASRSSPWVPMTQTPPVTIAVILTRVSKTDVETEDPTSSSRADDLTLPLHNDDPTPSLRADDPDEPNEPDDPRRLASFGDPSAVAGVDGLSFVDPEDPELPPGSAYTSSSSFLSESAGSNDETDDEDTLDEVQQTKKAKKKAKVNVRPDPSRFSLSDEKSLQLKPSLHAVSKKFVTTMHDELSSGNGNWRKSFSRKRIERALSTEIIPGKILGRGRARVSSRELAKFRRLSADGARISSGKGKGIDRKTSSKRRRVDTYLAAVIDREASASGVAAPSVSGLLHDEAYAATKSKASELSLLFDRLVGASSVTEASATGAPSVSAGLRRPTVDVVTGRRAGSVPSAASVNSMSLAPVSSDSAIAFACSAN
ncbi:hypothetical protein AALP_AA3G283200 [Arabis alpina]|uniref:Uncharacterized protein n=1 Tax=Arabis alpina TaxID=50452 RepID=A0A087HCA1_ARAAL|nr:hypothetical protein AALP_AA3G283200 [Arabis alpina]